MKRGRHVWGRSCSSAYLPAASAEAKEEMLAVSKELLGPPANTPIARKSSIGRCWSHTHSLSHAHMDESEGCRTEREASTVVSCNLRATSVFLPTGIEDYACTVANGSWLPHWKRSGGCRNKCPPFITLDEVLLGMMQAELCQRLQ